VLSLVETIKRAVFDPPEVSGTVDGFVEKTGGCLSAGLNVMESATLPTNPFRLTNVKVELPVSPLPRDMSPRLLAIAKVGAGAAV
jgi:hypothetical protein